MKQFERCKESENWGNRDAIKWLKLSLTGIAREEFENTGNHVTFLDAKEALFTRYLTRADRDSASARVKKMRQGWNQPVYHFFEEVIELGEIAYGDMTRDQNQRELSQSDRVLSV
ncbi:MAG: hypothetical protein GY696_20295 [Gammaproteobacteria bacterium]|nr:hypothetical protein [Gammaproteobacteria bacterium]